ncbi:MAG: hypothetical protein KAT90_00130 [Gammaproteobacteria bacterium]|nr:hypothetical protein [Gammaproteobacteria bacterium]
MFDLLPQNSIKTELNIADASFQESAKTSMSQDVQSVAEVKSEKGDLSVFFGIGMTVNIIMIVSFFIWAVKQWKKNDTNKK